MNVASLDWSRIRPIAGSQQAAFEELCAQLARVESPKGSSFVRKGTPDAGVECYAVLSNGDEWAWQAKFFNRLGDAQWSQLDSSVETALDKHPRIVRHHICVPYDRPDGRISGQRSAMERWNDHVAKWKGWATERKMTVDFVYWGNHELLTLLARPEHAGRTWFWFDRRSLDDAWFDARLQEALKAAGPRYTPELHIELPIAETLDALGRTDAFWRRLKAFALPVRKALQMFGYSRRDVALLPKAVHDVTEHLESSCEQALTTLGQLQEDPSGVLPLPALAKSIEASAALAAQLETQLLACEKDYRDRDQADGRQKRSTYSADPFSEHVERLFRLRISLEELARKVTNADSFAASRELILTGKAGTGKTHLLCDVAKQRLAGGRPTVLLMGQRFLQAAEPWAQALEQLDLRGVSAEAFVGGFEAAAQAAGCRALLVVDAINEGAGRDIWPAHLDAFLAHLGRSRWIAVVLAVRTSYARLVVPDHVLARAARSTHHGFADHEYDATRSFFKYYGLEFPSCPLLMPEFRNPLFLKTLCCGLRDTGRQRLPRGAVGISEAFGMFLDGINRRLAKELGYDATDNLVLRALHRLARAMAISGDSFLLRADARAEVDAELPGRTFDQSLFRSLVSEGVLTEDALDYRQGVREEYIFLGYERLGDHLIAEHLLDDLIGPGKGASKSWWRRRLRSIRLRWKLLRDRFSNQRGRLSFLYDSKGRATPGLIEALCIQVPEKAGQELFELFPKVRTRWEFADAFRQSLVWRAPSAFSEATLKAIGVEIRSDHDLHGTLDVLLTMATLPEHPLNARYLDGRLRRYSMPDRDSWWSTYLHSAWHNGTALDRLIDWAAGVAPGEAIDNEAADLCSIALAWTFSTPNRFVRDRATTAAVNLLTGRLEAVELLMRRFADVDDPYILQRVTAVAYGAAMRSADSVAVDSLARCVYETVFHNRVPPADILLCDYSRGVVERAASLGAAIGIDLATVRPAYGSPWPRIPSEDDIRPLLKDYDEHDDGDRHLRWARRRIASSVMNDDFALYVIGTNSSTLSSEWLSLRLDEPQWRPPPRPETLQRALVADLAEHERKAWDQFDKVDRACRQERLRLVFRDVEARNGETDDSAGDETSDSANDGSTADDSDEASKRETDLEATRSAALGALERVLTDEHKQQLRAAFAAEDVDPEQRQGPRFDLKQLQRYILRRVFDLGWTVERFGHFDGSVIGIHGRDAAKPERMGKKYQWIAYHEIMALLADNFQFRELYREENGAVAYDGPWQIHMRDIDPSCPMPRIPGGTGWDSHARAWWAPASFAGLDEACAHEDWLRRCDNLPSVGGLLCAERPSDRSRWVNLYGHFTWRQETPPDQESTDVDRRDLWCLCFAYLIRTADVAAFMTWAETVNFMGRWMPEPPHFHGWFLGEYGWSPAFRHFAQPYFGDEGWKRPAKDCPVEVLPTFCEYNRGDRGFDCSVEDGYVLHLPAVDLVSAASLHWSGVAADFVDEAGTVGCFDPTAHESGPTSLLFRKEALSRALARDGLAIVWTVLGEKRMLGSDATAEQNARVTLSGAYALHEGRPLGFLKFLLDKRPAEEEPTLLTVLRTDA